MNSFRLALCLLAAPYAFAGGDSSPPSSLLEEPARYVLRPIAEPFAGTSGEVAKVADLDRDGYDELILSQRHGIESRQRYTLEIRDHSGRRIMAASELDADFHPSGHSTLDVDGDGMLEVTVSYVTHDSLFLDVFDRSAERVAHIPVLGKEDSPRANSASLPDWIPGLRPQAVLDCNGDGKPEILCTGGCGYWRLPRGIWSLDWVHQRVLWFFPTGAKTTDLVVVPDTTGTPGIVVSTYTVMNGAVFNGTNDLCSYIIALSPDGKLTHLHALSDSTRTGTKVAVLTGESDAPRLLSFTSRGDLKDPEPATFRIWHGAADSVISWSSAEITDTDLVTADIDGDGQEEFLLATHRGELAVYRADLTLKRRIPVGHGKLLVSAVGDFDNDGLPEAVMGRGKGCVLVDPLHGEILASLAGHFPISVVRHGPQAALTLLTRSPLGWSQLSVADNPMWTRPGAFRVNWFLAGGVGFVVLMIGLFAASSFDRGIALPSLPTCRSRGMALINRRGQLLCTNGAFRRLCGLDDAPAEGAFLDRILWNAAIVPSLTVDHLARQTGQWTVALVGEGRKQERISFRMIPTGRGRWRRALVEVREDNDSSGKTARLGWATIAPRVAHDLKSPLSTLALATERVLRGGRSDRFGEEKCKSLLQIILHQVERIELISRNFLKLADLEKPSMALVDSGELLTESLNALRHRIPPEIIVEKKIDKKLPLLWADREQILTALENLFENSLAALGDGGSILFSAYSVAAMPGSEETKRPAVAVEVGDTGIGIASPDLPHVFEAGFTRRAKGSGLGLAIVKRVTEQHQGHVEVHSEPGIGTTFALYLPAAGSE